MTIATIANRVNYRGDGVILQFSFSFKAINDSHIIPSLDAVDQGSGFTVNRNANQDTSPGGTVDFAVAPANLVNVTLRRIVPLTQQTDYTEYDPFPAETHETALDTLTMQVQQLDDSGERSLKAPITDDGTADYTLPTADASKFFRWNPAGDALENVDIANLGAVSLQDIVSKTGDNGAAKMPYGTTAQRPASPASGYLRFNTDFNRSEEWDGTSWKGLGGAGGAGGDSVFYENDQSVDNDYTLTTGKNAITAGPISIATGVTVTIPTGQTWSIVG